MNAPCSWFAALCDVFVREIKGIYQSRGIVAFCFYAPVFWILVVWALLGNGIIQKAKVAFIDNDRTPLTREIARAISAQEYIGLESWTDPRSALDALAAGEVYGVLLIPAGYTRDSLKGRGGSLVLWADENRYAVAGTLRVGLNEVMSAIHIQDVYASVLKTGAGPTISRRLISAVHSDFYSLGNQEGSFLGFLGGTLIPSLIMIAAMFGFLTAFLRELWHKSVSRWLACAGGRFSVAIVGKLLPWYFIYSLIFMFYMALFSGEGGFNITGPVFAWALLGFLCLADFASVAILIAALSPTWRMALVAGAGYAAPALPFTGFSIPQDSMGEAARIFGECLPLTWLVQGQADVWTLGSSLADLGAPLAAMALLIFIPASIGAPLLKIIYGKRAMKEERAS